jgi:DNA-binding FrmR family transcriptional regulator
MWWKRRVDWWASKGSRNSLLDTREKIVPLGDLTARLGDGKWLAVVGRFDPMTAAQAIRIEESGGQGRAILAVVEEGEDCLLPVEARAALVAALRSVELVVIAGATALKAYPKIEIVEDEEGERARSAEFVEFVRRRQGA